MEGRSPPDPRQPLLDTSQVEINAVEAEKHDWQIEADYRQYFSSSLQTSISAEKLPNGITLKPCLEGYPLS